MRHSASGGGSVASSNVPVLPANAATETTLLALKNKTAQAFFTLPFDAITVTYPSSTQEVYVSRTGGIGGAVVQTLTVNYTTALKTELLNVSVV